MKYLFLSFLILCGCSSKENPDPKHTPEGNAFWSAYSKRMRGRCFSRWDNQEVVISIDDVNKNPSWVAICDVGQVCDYQNGSKCINHKVCSSYSHGSILYERIQENYYLEHKCHLKVKKKT